MNVISFFANRVGVSQRFPHLIDVIVRNPPLVTDFRLWASRSLNDAYGTVEDSGLSGTGGTAILETRVNGLAASPSIVRRGAHTVAEVRRGQTSFMFDPDDYSDPLPGPLPSDVPSDDEYMCVRVQERRQTTGWAAVAAGATKNADMPFRGPILVVPDPFFFGRAASVMSLAGTAPAGSDCAVGVPPIFDPTGQKPMPMHIVFPRPMGSLTIRNMSASESLLVCFGWGQPMVEVVKGDSILPTGGGYSLPGVTELIIAMNGAGGGCSFHLDGVIGLSC